MLSKNHREINKLMSVLILVLMEYALEDFDEYEQE